VIDLWPDMTRATRPGVAPLPEKVDPVGSEPFLRDLTLERAVQLTCGHREDVLAPAESMTLFDLLTERVGSNLTSRVLKPEDQSRLCRLLLEEYSVSLPDIDSVIPAAERVCNAIGAR